MIQATDIIAELGGKRILSGVSCSIVPGKITMLLGRNGAGKSTLLWVLAGELAPSNGQLLIDQHPLQRISVSELANYRAVLSQQTQLAYNLRVEEVIEIGCYNRYHSLSRVERQDLLRQAMVKLGVNQFRGRAFQTLSGGEQKRVLLAKCLVQLWAGRKVAETQYLLLDEPTAALDIAQQYRFFEIIKSLATEQGIGVLAIVHDLNLAARYGNEIIILRDGGVIAKGTAWDVFQPDILRQAYGIACLVQTHPQFNVPLITTYGNYSATTTTSEVA